MMSNTLIEHTTLADLVDMATVPDVKLAWFTVWLFEYVTGSERTHLPRIQQEDTLFTITR